MSKKKTEAYILNNLWPLAFATLLYISRAQQYEQDRTKHSLSLSFLAEMHEVAYRDNLHFAIRMQKEGQKKFSKWGEWQSA